MKDTRRLGQQGGKSQIRWDKSGRMREGEKEDLSKLNSPRALVPRRRAGEGVLENSDVWSQRVRR